VVFLTISIILISVSVFAQEGEDALALYRQGNYQEAVEVCLDELEAQPRRMDAHVVLGWSLLKQGDYQEALERAQEAHQISPGDYRVIEILGEAHFHLGNNLKALRHFEEYTVLAPTGDRIDTVYYYMGEIFIRLGEYNHADIAFSTALYHSPNIAGWWARLGYAQEMAKDYEYALESYNKALRLNSSHPEALRGKERVQRKMESG
jgi:tetratricopeptide (TPR) repeat protein